MVEFDYQSTSLRHEHHYKLNLAKPVDNALCHKLLERVFLTSIEARDSVIETQLRNEENVGEILLPKQHDEWKNSKFNGVSFTLDSWVVSQAENGATSKHEENRMHISVQQTWKVPSKGLLELDFHTAHPCKMLVTHLVYNLNSPKSKSEFLDLWTRCSHTEGKNIWNAKVGGRSITFHESLYYDKQVLSMLPSSGILHIDHIECVAVESTKWMLRFPIKFDDLKNAEQRRNLACLTRRSKNIGAGELWLDIQIGDKTLLQSEVAADSWVPPRKGQLAFEIIVYVKDRPLSPDMFIRISEELSQQENEAGRQQLLQAYLSEGRPLFTSEMVAILMEMFRPGDSQWNLFRSLCGYTIDPFNHIFTCFHLLDKQKQKLVRRWLEEGKKF